MRNYAKISEFPTSGDTLGLVYDRMRNYAKISEFSQERKYTRTSESPHAETQEDMCITQSEDLHYIVCISPCGNTRGNVYLRMRKYTRIGVLPHAVIHRFRPF